MENERVFLLENKLLKNDFSDAGHFIDIAILFLRNTSYLQIFFFGLHEDQDPFLKIPFVLQGI